MMRPSLFLASLGFLVGLLGMTASAAAEEPVDFNRDIRPILSNNCFACHGPNEKDREAELRLDVEEDAFAKRDELPAITPGDLSKSGLWQRITSDDEDERMPPADTQKTLSPKQIELIKKWIEQGAKWRGHWSFITPEKPALPKVSKQAWVRNSIDAFTLARMDKAGLKPSPEADRATLLRRVSFDLTGLPPTPEEIDAFENDNSDGAYEKVVDRLLASRHYGERMTLGWMDAARYGDSSVHHADGPRDMWAWRDWVIRAYNTNMPFDQFTVEQLAGDLLPNATVAQKVATGFNRNHGTTDEGGAIAEEYRVEYIVDRVKTTANVWLGITMECGQCHTHKFDPISQKEYYQFFAFFNQSADKGMQTRNGNAAPKISTGDLLATVDVTEVNKKIAAAEKLLAAHISAAGPKFDVWLKEASAKIDKNVPLPGGMLAHWTLDEKQGNTVTDAVDPKRKGTIKGNALWETGKHGGALRFDGSNFVDLGDIANFDSGDKFSYGGWINSAGGVGAPIARMNDKNKYRGYDLYSVNGKFAMHLISAFPNDAIKVITKKTFPLNKWHHVMVTYDGSSTAAGVKIYVNGKSQPWDIEQDSLKGTTKSKVPLYLGRRNPGSVFKGLVDDVRIYPRTLTAAEAAALAGSDPIGPLLALPADKRSKQQTETLRTHYLNSRDPQYAKLQADLNTLRGQRDAKTKTITTVMIMQDLPGGRKTYILNRGHYASPIKTEVILPGVPAFLPPMPKDAPKNRLGLARWLTEPTHPLTGRVAVNRYWQMIFGRGIVTTVMDFGSQGDWPSHPQLLDWLATDFTSHGWNVKRTLKQIVMSATYRQSSRITPELKAKDPENRLLARGPRFRLQGEFIRDNALAASGLLVRKIGGPSVKPYQPPGLWNEVSLGGNVRFKQDKGDKLYRRSMYIYWKRSATAPSMRIFDAPSREKCVMQRQRTNTPLQALVTLNDPQFVEAARALAQRIMTAKIAGPEDRIRLAYRLTAGRLPSSKTLGILLDSYQEELEYFKKQPESAKQLLSVGESKRDEKLDAAQHAAWTIVASMILNLDETLTKR